MVQKLPTTLGWLDVCDLVLCEREGSRVCDPSIICISSKHQTSNHRHNVTVSYSPTPGSAAGVERTRTKSPVSASTLVVCGSPLLYSGK